MRYILFFIILLINSCSSKKDIIYLNVPEDVQNFEYSYETHKIEVDDILKIDVITDNIELAYIYDPKLVNTSVNNSLETLTYSGYIVSKKGEINFPIIGKIYVQGLTIEQTRDLIYDTIVKNGQLINPQVDVKLLNKKFTILGEVNKPGRYSFIENNLNIFEAIGLAGDLTITGNRKNIKIIRKTINGSTINSVNITDNSIFDENLFQIKAGDIIIVNPNITRVKNAGIIGNSGTLLSLLSFLLSSIIIINN